MQNFKETDIVIAFVASTIIFFLLVMVVIYLIIQYQKNVLKQKEALRQADLRYQKQILEASIVIAEKERAELAKNLHDEVGVLINVMNHKYDALLMSCDKPEEVKENAETTKELLKKTSESIRLICTTLSSATLNYLGLVRAIRQLCAFVHDSTDITCLFTCEEEIVIKDTERELQLFRTMKELMNNILKHSESTKIQVDMLTFEQDIFITIIYNGRGITDEDLPELVNGAKGIGLKSIFARVQILQGKIHYLKPEENYVISLEIPLQVK